MPVSRKYSHSFLPLCICFSNCTVLQRKKSLLIGMKQTCATSFRVLLMGLTGDGVGSLEAKMQHLEAASQEGGIPMLIATLVLAAALNVGGLLLWLLLGLIAGFVASRVMGAGGYGLVGDIV